ncbi:MAG: XRE family transcriptional regulator [Acidobacteria bacterium]|nr:XRE family transcriptional regulator [Acidobacteriota bacterium]
MGKKKKSRLFVELKEAMEDVLAYERGEKTDLRVTEFPPIPKQMKPEEIRKIRAALHASQALFAMLLNVSPKAVQSWEQGARRPQRAALKLPVLAKNNPRLLLRA